MFRGFQIWATWINDVVISPEGMLTPREKSPLPKMSPEEDRTRDAVDSEPKHYQLSYSGPFQIIV